MTSNNGIQKNENYASNSSLTNISTTHHELLSSSTNNNKYFTKGPTLTHTLHYPWEVVTQAYESRFPTNKHFPYIKKTDVEKDVLEDGVQNISRVITIDVPVPHWLKRLTGISDFSAREHTTIDHNKQNMIIDTKNVTLADSVILTEHCEYSRSEENENWTLKTQSANMSLIYCERHTCLGLRSAVESFCESLFVMRAKDALEREKGLLKQNENEKN